MLSLQFPLLPIIKSLSPKLKPSSPTLRTSHLSYRINPHASSSESAIRATAHDVVVNGRVASAEAPAEEDLFPSGLLPESIPNHVAVIMDGNRRWASVRGLPVGYGYEAGLRSLRGMVELCCKWGIRVLTVFAFSSENWSRPKVEVDFLMKLFERGVKEDLESFVREDIRISVIGDCSKLPKSLQELISDAEETTKNNLRLQLIVAVSYSGKYDIVQACQSIALKVKDGLIEHEDIDESLIEQELETNCTEFPYPDLLIRTSGELRISNFFLWQLSYTELFFVQSLWPDFGEAEFLEALRSFQERQRRYGGRNFKMLDVLQGLGTTQPQNLA